MRTSSPLSERLRVLKQRPDFQLSPSAALFRRLTWRLRWRLTKEPWVLAIGEDLKIQVPCCGAGALIYYQGYSEPETARFILSFLRPGMVFFDVGAHIGEYALLASRRVGPCGEVHAFEPQPSTLALLENNVEVNGLRNVRLNGCAVSDRDEEVDFGVRAEPSLSSIVREGKPLDGQELLCSLKVPSRTLDEYCGECGRWPDLIKIDVEGAELLVLQGAEGLLAEPPGRAPCLVFEYDEDNYSRFGYEFRDILSVLGRAGYRMFRLDPQGRPQLIDGEASLPDGVRNIMATKAILSEPASLN
jgi:methyltransferase, FkbM family